MNFSQEWEDAKEFLYSKIHQDDWYIVCIEHMRFIPCRSCMYGTPATTPYSAKFEDVKTVRIYHLEKDNYGQSN